MFRRGLRCKSRGHSHFPNRLRSRSTESPLCNVPRRKIRLQACREPRRAVRSRPESRVVGCAKASLSFRGCCPVLSAKRRIPGLAEWAAGLAVPRRVPVVGVSLRRQKAGSRPKIRRRRTEAGRRRTKVGWSSSFGHDLDLFYKNSTFCRFSMPAAGFTVNLRFDRMYYEVSATKGRYLV